MKNIIIILILLVSSISSITFGQKNDKNDKNDKNGLDTLVNTKPIDIDSIDEVKYCEDVLAAKFDPKYANLSDSVKLLLIARYISHFTYDYERKDLTELYNANSNNVKEKYVTLREFIKLKKGVCRDFARIILILGRQLKIVTDMTMYKDHSWNYIVYNNNEYYLDGTLYCKRKPEEPPKKYYYLWEIMSESPQTTYITVPGKFKAYCDFCEKDMEEVKSGKNIKNVLDDVKIDLLLPKKSKKGS